MQRVDTIPSKTYVVTTANGCTVTTEDGLKLVEIEAGKQGDFVAIDSKVLLSDDSARLTPVFKLAPVAGGSGSGGGGLPKTDYLIYNSDYTEVSGNLDNLENGANMFYKSSALTTFTTDLPALTNGTSMFYQCSALTTFTTDLPALTNGASMFSSCVALTTFTTDLPALTNGTYMFSACRALTTFTADLPALADGASMFESCKLNKESALRVLNSIPAYTSGTHRLTIGIHVDHQSDEEVLAAISNAEAKGWTLTVQWKGTPTSTASMLRFGQLIYAKVSEGRDGERVLDWGHYVTDETGYETFRSLESAYEYFGLPMPEEESQPTE